MATQPTPEKIIIAGICALILTVGLARFSYTPLLPIMRDQADLSYVASGWLAAVNYVGYMAGALLASLTGDLHKKFVTYRIGLILAIVTTIAMGWTTDVVVWGVLRFVSGVSSTAGLLLASGLVLNHLVRLGRRPQLGVHFMGLGLGIAVSGIVVILTVGTFQWDGQWVVLGVIGLAFLIPAWYWLPPPQMAPAQSKKSEKAAATAPAGRWMQWMILAYFCAGFGFVVGATFIVAILERLPMLAGHGGWVWVVVGVAATPSSFLWDGVARRFGVYHALIVAYALQMVAMILPALSTGVFLNLIAAALFGATFVGIVSLTLTVVGRHFPANPAKAMARITLGYGVAQIFAPAMTGYMAQAMGGYEGALIVSTVILACGIVLLFLASRPDHASTRS